MILDLIYFLIFTASSLVMFYLEAKSEAIDFKNGVFDDHSGDVLFNIFVSVALSFFYLGVFFESVGDIGIIKVVLIFLSDIAYIFAIRFVSFDFIINKLRGKEPFYLGEGGENGSFTDGVFKKINPKILLIIRITTLIIILSIWILLRAKI